MKIKFVVNDRAKDRFNEIMGGSINYIKFGNKVYDIAMRYKREYGDSRLDVLDSIEEVFNEIDVSNKGLTTKQVVLIMQEIVSIVTRMEELD